MKSAHLAFATKKLKGCQNETNKMWYILDFINNFISTNIKYQI